MNADNRHNMHACTHKLRTCARACKSPDPAFVVNSFAMFICSDVKLHGRFISYFQLHSRLERTFSCINPAFTATPELLLTVSQETKGDSITQSGY